MVRATGPLRKLAILPAGGYREAAREPRSRSARQAIDVPRACRIRDTRVESFVSDRIAIELEVRVQDDPPRTVYTAEIGPGGLWLRGAEVPPPDRPVTLAIIDPAFGQLTVKGIVGQAPPGRDGVEVALFDNPPEVERRWGRLLERMAREAHLRPAMAEHVPSTGIPPTGPVPEPGNVVHMRTGPLPVTPQPAPQAEDAPPLADQHPDSGRAHPRRTSNLRITIRLSDGSTASAVARDLSEGGAFVTGSHLPAVGEELEVSIAHPVTGDPVELPATVVRSVDHGETRGVGIRFMADAGAHAPWAVFGGRLSSGRGVADRRDQSAGEASIRSERGDDRE